MARILIIEDDPYVRNFYERLFRLEAYDVKIVSDGETGINEARQNTPELILIDIMMPGENGLKVLKRLKEDEKTKKTKAVMLTNLEDEDSIKKAKDLGAEGYIIKSEADPKTLIGIVEDFLKKN